MNDHQIFELGDIDVQSGLRIRNAKLAYKTYGELNAAKDNVIVFPTFFGSQHPANEPMISPMSVAIPIDRIPMVREIRVAWIKPESTSSPFLFVPNK